MAFGRWLPFSRKPSATSAWPLTAVVAICVKEVLPIKDRERGSERAKNRGSLEESSWQHVNVSHVGEREGEREMGHEQRKCKERAKKVGWQIGRMGGTADLAFVVLWTPLLWGGQRNYWNVRMFSSNLTFLTEIRTGTLKCFVLRHFSVIQPYACADTGVVRGLALHPHESVCFSVQGPLFQKPCFLWQNIFHGTFPSEFVLIPLQLSRHHQFFMIFFIFLSVFSLWLETQQKLSLEASFTSASCQKAEVERW